MKTVVWSVRAKHAPAVVRYCKNCGMKSEFESSERFRVNAQQKKLDVWLIYKCLQCDSTWNLTILSRVSPGSIPPEQLHRFQNNDGDLAMRCATDYALIKRNGGRATMPEVEVLGEAVDLKEPTRLHIIPQYPVEIKLASLLRCQLGISRSAYDRCCASGSIRCVSGHDLKKGKLLTEMVLELA